MEPKLPVLDATKPRNFVPISIWRKIGLVAWLLVAFIPTMLLDAWCRITKRPKCLSNKVVVITGGGGGIGAELARQLAVEHDAIVCVCDVNQGRAYAYKCDVTKPEEMKSLAATLYQEHGTVDVVVANAGIACVNTVEAYADEEIRRVIDVNLMGVFWTIRAFLPQFYAKGEGHIVLVGSIASFMGEKWGAPYSASKFALRGIMDSLGCEIIDSGYYGRLITTIVHPFFVRTPLADGQAEVEARFMKVLDVSECAKEIVDAIRYEKKSVMVPASLWYAASFAPLLPILTKQLVRRTFGIRLHKENRQQFYTDANNNNAKIGADLH